MSQYNCVSCGEIKHHHIIPLYLSKTCKPFIWPVYPFQVGFSFYDWHCILSEREGERSIGHTRAICNFADIQMIPHEHGFFH